ncbi:hypothetical protein SLITO_v1c10390 [Spiroplasma litorale]|uniref:Uncharacterized protein n=1 Tax=Spiroplasma litorale TaxID=216942 RepID=A0A0K1W2U8_9MOLU|nr:hypothetical protein [Spiroplasma litorale]AKX34650.1 hypothetical protein SLITO_v1c10390 [Spiroplasma litorale]
MKNSLLALSLISLMILNFIFMISSTYLSFFGINYSMNYLNIEIKNLMNTFIEKNKYLINYENNKEYLSLIFGNINKKTIFSVKNGIGVYNLKKWKDFISLNPINYSNDLYYYYLSLINLPINYLKFFSNKLLYNNDFLINYEYDNFYMLKKLNEKESLIDKNYWYEINEKDSYYNFLYNSVYLFLDTLEQLILKQLNENINLFNNSNFIISDVISIKERKNKILSYSFYIVEFKKYIYNSYLNFIFLIIILPISWFFFLLMLFIKIIITIKKNGLQFKYLKFIFNFKYI